MLAESMSSIFATVEICKNNEKKYQKYQPNHEEKKHQMKEVIIAYIDCCPKFATELNIRINIVKKYKSDQAVFLPN